MSFCQNNFFFVDTIFPPLYVTIAVDYHLDGSGVDLPLYVPIAVDYQLGVDGVGDCSMRGNARERSIPSAKGQYVLKDMVKNNLVIKRDSNYSFPIMRCRTMIRCQMMIRLHT